jgi:cellulose synthase/poly-beta-1,6-N-acetylglucosamine synthase-like glycosyltransferase
VILTIFVVMTLAIFGYFVLYTLTTFALIGLSLVETSLVMVERGELFTPPKRLRRPGISVVAPAYNMEPIIVASVRSLLAADYDPLEVVIVSSPSRACRGRVSKRARPPNTCAASSAEGSRGLR